MPFPNYKKDKELKEDKKKKETTSTEEVPSVKDMKEDSDVEESGEPDYEAQVNELLKDCDKEELEKLIEMAQSKLDGMGKNKE